MKRFFYVIILLWFASIVQAAEVQTNLSSFVHQITLKRGATKTRLTQWVAPINIRLPFAGGHLDMRSAAMMAHQDTATGEYAIGMLNTQFQSQWLLGKRAMISLNVSLPTGKQSLNANDASLVQLLARNDLNFPVKTFGQGLDYGGALSLVRHRSHWTMSVGASYQRKGKYEPVASVPNYKPGDEASGSFGIDYTFGSFVYRFSAAGTYYLTDRQNGVVVFQNGKQILLQAGLLYTGRAFRFKAEVTEIARLKNRDLISGTLLYESRDSNGNDLRAHLEASWTPARFLTLFGTGYAKTLTANAHPVGLPLYQGDAYLVEGGGGIALSFGRLYHLNLRATRLSGKAEDKAVRLSAFHVRGALTILF